MNSKGHLLYCILPVQQSANSFLWLDQTYCFVDYPFQSRIKKGYIGMDDKIGIRDKKNLAIASIWNKKIFS